MSALAVLALTRAMGVRVFDALEIPADIANGSQIVVRSCAAGVIAEIAEVGSARADP